MKKEKTDNEYNVLKSVDCVQTSKVLQTFTERDRLNESRPWVNAKLESLFCLIQWNHPHSIFSSF